MNPCTSNLGCVIDRTADPNQLAFIGLDALLWLDD
jgi:hypothetical protein